MENKKRKERGLTQLGIEIPIEFYQELKLAAERRSITIKTWIIREMINGLKRDDLAS